jgi:hypothetical protein
MFLPTKESRGKSWNSAGEAFEEPEGKAFEKPEGKAFEKAERIRFSRGAGLSTILQAT